MTKYTASDAMGQEGPRRTARVFSLVLTHLPWKRTLRVVADMKFEEDVQRLMTIFAWERERGAGRRRRWRHLRN